MIGGSINFSLLILWLTIWGTTGRLFLAAIIISAAATVFCLASEALS